MQVFLATAYPRLWAPPASLLAVPSSLDQFGHRLWAVYFLTDWESPGMQHKKPPSLPRPNKALPELSAHPRPRLEIVNGQNKGQVVSTPSVLPSPHANINSTSFLYHLPLSTRKIKYTQRKGGIMWRKDTV